MDENTKLNRAQDIIKTHVLVSMGAGLVPIPIVDIAAVTAVQIDMLKNIARLFDIPYHDNSGKGFITALTGSALARIGASAIKAIPIIGSILGGISMSILSGASTYALGQVFLQHFLEGGTFADFDLQTAKRLYEEELERGKKKAAEWQEEEEVLKATKKDNDDVLYEKLERIGKLRESGVISEEEFQRMKEDLLGNR